MEDPYDDFAGRYMFAFWRLIAQGITTTEPSTAPSPQHPAGDAWGSAPYDPEVRVIRLATPSSRTEDQAEEKKLRVYHHRWPVRMHKVRQWYPVARNTG